MSFWSGKKESLLQSLVEITFKAVLSGLVIVFFAQFLIVMVDNQIKVASKRDALNTFRNDQLTTLTTQFSDAFLALDCTQSVRGVTKDECPSNIGKFLTKLDVIFLELRVHYPNAGFPKLLELKVLAETMRATPSQVSQGDINNFAATFGATLDEMAHNFR
jgi:hypothetical protein